MTGSEVRWDPECRRTVAAFTQHLGRCPVMVHLWLSLVELPRDAWAHEGRISASAWHLAEAMRGAVGFSGTAEGHRLSPPSVAMRRHEDESLRGSDGAMLSLLLSKSVCSYATLPLHREGPGIALLEHAVAKRYDAVIDAGGLLCSTPCEKVLSFLENSGPRLDSRFRGVAMWRSGRWVVHERGVWRPGCELERSRVRPADALVVFSQAQCRGAELELGRHARGLMSLDPDATKDTVIQAAGRMRRLGHGQRLDVVACEDVSRAIKGCLERRDEPPEIEGRGGEALMKDVLSWLLENTVRSVVDGLDEWVTHGMDWHKSVGSREAGRRRGERDGGVCCRGWIMG